MNGVKEFVDKVKNTIDILQIIQQYTGIQGKKVGQYSYDFSPCPFCGHNNCFRVNIERQFFYCFSEGLGGDVFRFIARKDSISDWEAMITKANEYGINLQKKFFENKKEWEEERKTRDILLDTSTFYHSQIEKYPEAKSYLIENRGFSERIIEEYKLGYAPPGKKTLLKDYLILRGYTMTEIIKSKIANGGSGENNNDYFSNFGGGYITFPDWLYGGVVDIQGRAFPDKSPKYLTRKGEIKHLYNEGALRKEKVFLCEGIPNTLTMLQSGFNACGIYGTGGFKEEWVDKFEKVKKVFIFMDPDDPGRKAALKIATILGAKSRIITLSEPNSTQDINDYFINTCKRDIEIFKEKIQFLMENASFAEDIKLQNEEPVKNVHLTDINDSCLANKKVRIQILVSAIGETYLVPKVIEIGCRRGYCDYQQKCELGDKKPHLYVVKNNDPILIEFTRTSKEGLFKHIKRWSPCKLSDRSDALFIEVKEDCSVQEILGVPVAKRIKAQMLPQGSQVRSSDEYGREYKDKILYHIGTFNKSNQHYQVSGWVIPSPKGQEATLIFSEKEEITGEYENFVITPEIQKEFEVFQLGEHQTIDEKVKEILNDITDNITNIYGEHRHNVLLSCLLTYHSILGFVFDNERVKRGWMEVLMIGDTGEGKTQIVMRLMEATDLGESLDGVSASRTGISYSYQQHGNKSWFLVWGKYPLNDGKLLFVDEAQRLAPSDIDNMRMGRSEGYVSADGVKKGEHNTRTRLIFACNPKFSGVIDDNMFGIEVVKEVFKDEDIRRFDMTIILSSSDQSKDVVNKLTNQRNPVPQKIKPKILRNSICWAWTRKPEHVYFIDDAAKEIIEVSKRLSEKYGNARDIPLVSTDIRHKIARLSVALASLLHSTDETYEKVIVKNDHVRFIEKFLETIYSHPNCSYNLYAKIKNQEGTLKDEEYSHFLEDLKKGDHEKRKSLPKLFVNYGRYGISRSDLARELGVSEEWTSSIVRFLKKHRLIRVKRGKGGGYISTPKFIQILKRMVKEEKLEI